MLRVEYDMLSGIDQEPYAVLDHIQVRVECYAQCFFYLEVPCLPEDAAPFGARIDERLEIGVLLRTDVMSPGAAESDELRPL